MKKFLRRFFFKSFLYVGLPILLLAGGYAWWAKSRLDGVVNAEWSIYQVTTVAREASEVKTSFSRVVRAAVRRKDGANFRPYGPGVVADVYDWSPGSNEWVAVPMRLEEQAESLQLQTLRFRLPGELIELLGDQSRKTREVAFNLLRARTEQDFGYRYDQPPGTQKAAIDKWRSWWEANKLTWTVGKGLEAVLKGGKDEKSK